MRTMKNIHVVSWLAIAIGSIAGCKDNSHRLIYKSDEFSVYGNRVEQGIYKAEARDEKTIISDYQSPANMFFDPSISFKLSVNGRDNEAPAGQDHRAFLVPGEDGKVVVKCTFGQKDPEIVGSYKPGEKLPANIPVRFEVDMKNVISAFDRDGWFTDFNGVRIYKSDFKGVWIAGGTAPLSWDFENLMGRNDLRLTDTDGDGVFTCDLMFNAYDPSKQKAAERTVTKDISGYPALITPYPLITALYNMSLEEMMLDIRTDSTFMAGKEWNGVWTRDISYSIILSLAAIEPAIARNSLMRKVKNGLIIQDTGTGGSWPVSTDRQVWSLAAWEVYKSTGDTAWLRQAYDIISASVERDIKTAFDKNTGLFYGESSFLDWRKQTYPVWMDPVDIYLSHNLGTNAVFYGTLDVLDRMGKILGDENDYGRRAEELKKAINSNLWLDSKDYYGQYMYGHYSYSLSPRSESLGEALCILLGIAGDEQKDKMFQSVPVMEYGIPCIYPQIPGIPPYHNNASWPFVQAYWTWAGAKSHNTGAVEHGIASIFRQAALFLTNKENMVAENGDYNGTQINSDYQLWSVAGDLAVTYRVIFGLEYEADGLRFNPFIPKSLAGDYQLNGLKFRNAELDIEVKNYGDAIVSFKIDGESVSGNRVPATLAGKHTISIIMNGKQTSSKESIAPGKFSPDTPVASLKSEELSWPQVQGASKYAIFRNSHKVAEINDLSYKIPSPEAGEYQVMAVGEDGTGSFLSKPVPYMISENAVTLEAEEFSAPSPGDVFGYSGKGFVALEKESKAFVFTLKAEAEGDYVIGFRYANGNGPINTDNKCAQRSLFLDGTYLGTIIFPQRGLDEWSDWGLSSPLTIHLIKGINNLELKFMDYNNNMNVEKNGFLLDNIICFPAEILK